MNKSVILIKFVLVFLVTSCKREELTGDDWVGHYVTASPGYSTLQIEQDPHSSDRLVLRELFYYETTAVLTSSMTFSIPEQLCEYPSYSGGGGCSGCVLPPFIAKYSGYGEINQYGLQIVVFEYRKFIGEPDFAFCCKDEYTFVKE